MPPPFWSLVEAHGDELLRHARRLVGDSDAEDVLQESLLRALRAYPRLTHGDQLRAWLYRVTTTTAYDAHRARAREVLAEQPPAQGIEPEHYDDAFDALIAALPESRQAAVRLRFVEDLDYDTIARRLGCSPMAARQRVSAAVRSLRREMTP